MDSSAFIAAKRFIARVDFVGLGFKAVGVPLAASGISHFVVPRPFTFVSKPVFPEDTSKWVKVNGALETALGVTLIERRTRLVGVVGSIVYAGYLGDRVSTAIAVRRSTTRQ